MCSFTYGSTLQHVPGSTTIQLFMHIIAQIDTQRLLLKNNKKYLLMHIVVLHSNTALHYKVVLQYYIIPSGRYNI